MTQMGCECPTEQTITGRFCQVGGLSPTTKTALLLRSHAFPVDTYRVNRSAGGLFAGIPDLIDSVFHVARVTIRINPSNNQHQRRRPTRSGLGTYFQYRYRHTFWVSRLFTTTAASSQLSMSSKSVPTPRDGMLLRFSSACCSACEPSVVSR